MTVLNGRYYHLYLIDEDIQEQLSFQSVLKPWVFSKYEICKPHCFGGFLWFTVMFLKLECAHKSP